MHGAEYGIPFRLPDRSRHSINWRRWWRDHRSGADALLASLNEMMAEAKDKKSLLYRLTSDKEMANKLDSLLTNGHKLIEQIRLQGVDANIRFFHSTTPQK